MTTSPREQQERLADEIARFSGDPLGFVMAAFPWGEPGPLANRHGPEPWQRDVLEEIGRHIRSSKAMDEAFRLARRSGHGIGKSALVAWLIVWSMSTHPNTRGVVTASTESQLKTKTIPELAKWHGMSITRAWFRLTATSFAAVDPARERGWRMDLVPWSETNPEAFQGLHHAGGRIVVIFDEASGIADPIWEVIEGVLTDADTERLWLAFGNPTRARGRFADCFGKFAHRWRTASIDSREVSFTSQQQIAEWVQDYGEDSDFVRVRVRGLPPKAGSEDQFIGATIIEKAQARVATNNSARVAGVDIARFGDDKSVFLLRSSNGIPYVKTFSGLDLMELSSRLAGLIDMFQPLATFVDGAGVGGGVVDRLSDLGYLVEDVNGAAKARDDRRHANRRAEMWSDMRRWLRDRGSIPEDRRDLADELQSVGYLFDTQQRLLIESKRDLKARGGKSPDLADALALTFAEPVSLHADFRDRLGGDAIDWSIADYGEPELV